MKKRFYIFITIILSLIVAVICVYELLSNSILFRRYYESEIKISSPDGNCTIFIDQFSAAGGSGADVYYKRKNDFEKKRIRGLTFDDYLLPFSNEEMYLLLWEENGVEIKYYSGTPSESADDPETWRNFYIKYS